MVGALITVLWALLTLGAGAAGMWFISRFFRNDYGGNRRKRLFDNFLGMALFSLATMCFLMATAEAKQGSSSLSMVPVALCLGAIVLPIGMIGMYWRSFQSEILFGKYTDVIGERKPDAQVSEARPEKARALPGLAIRVGISLAGWMVGATAMFGWLYWRPESSLVCGALVLMVLGGFFGPVIWLWWVRHRSKTS